MTYNEQANIKFEELQPDIVAVPNITGVFSADGNLTVPNRQLLIDKINEGNLAKHLKIVLVKSLTWGRVNAPDIVGVSDYGQDWAIVEASVSQLDAYSHETGHSLDLTTVALPPPDGSKHESPSVKAPNNGPPLMGHSVGSTRWIRQRDWRTANAQAASPRYGN